MQQSGGWHLKKKKKNCDKPLKKGHVYRSLLFLAAAIVTAEEKPWGKCVNQPITTDLEWLAWLMSVWPVIEADRWQDLPAGNKGAACPCSGSRAMGLCWCPSPHSSWIHSGSCPPLMETQHNGATTLMQSLPSFNCKLFMRMVVSFKEKLQLLASTVKHNDLLLIHALSGS